MDDEKLIESVRKYPVIFDMTHSKYMDKKYKSNIWNIVANEVNETDDICKKRWNNIRDQYKRNLNKRKTKSGQEAVNIKKYKYEENLQFLLPHVHERNTYSNVVNEDEAHHNNKEINTPQNIENSPSLSLTETEPILLQASTVPSTNPVNSIRSSTDRKHRSSPLVQRSASNTLMKYILETNLKQHTVHPIDAFFNGLAPTIKKFSPYYQHLAKGQIFKVVQDLEWEQISGDPASYIRPGRETTSTETTLESTTTTPTPPPSSDLNIATCNLEEL